MRHLHEDFTYTLDRPATPRGQSALLDFLLLHREGHCEFFASAFVVLARVLGIPARLVAGYRVVEHNGFGGYAVVRAKHAHAWAEAYVPVPSDPARSAFEVFDPTPPAPTLAESRARTVSALLDYVWTRWSRSTTRPWRRRSERSPRSAAPRSSRSRCARAQPPPAGPRGRGRRRRAARSVVQFEARLAKEGFVRDRAETLESFAGRLEVGGPEPPSTRAPSLREGALRGGGGVRGRARAGAGAGRRSARLVGRRHWTRSASGWTIRCTMSD